MTVTEVRVFPVDEDKLRAYVTITLDHCFVIRDLKIIHSATGFFVSMPSKKRKDGTASVFMGIEGWASPPEVNFALAARCEPRNIKGRPFQSRLQLLWQQ